MLYFRKKQILPGLRLLIMTSVVFPVVAAAWPQRGTVIESNLLASYKRDEIAAFLTKEPASEQPQCDVHVIELNYATVGVSGEPTTASGVLLIPDGSYCPAPYPMLSWGPMISALRHAGQAQAIFNAKGNTPLVTRLASQGYVVVGVDYLGLGNSDYSFHPYLHASSEASATIDAMRAARSVLQGLKTPLSDKVMVSGFSQGGHEALATQREIEAHLSNEFSLVASTPISGPYALSKTILDSWYGRSDALDLVPLATALIIGMQRTYHNIYFSPLEVFREPFADEVEAWFPGDRKLTLDDFPKPDQIKTYFQPRFYRDFYNPGNPFRVDLVRNNLLRWAPQAPTLLCGSSNDSLIPLENAVSAMISFKRHGSKQVSVLDVDAGKPRNKDANDGLAAHLASMESCIIAVRHQLLDKQR
ncbi:MAG TPA: alpha/beta hydrolase [Xylella taiwanensis]